MPIPSPTMVCPNGCTPRPVVVQIGDRYACKVCGYWLVEPELKPNKYLDRDGFEISEAEWDANFNRMQAEIAARESGRE
jgi:hypothetical protein